MRVLFLDIDGVLNSSYYDPVTDADGTFRFIDETRLPLLQRIIRETGAVIVLSSTWRDCWEKDPALCDKDGRYLIGTLAKYGLSVFDKTHYTELYYPRAQEIGEWLKAHGREIESFAILDDDVFDWGILEGRVVKTDPETGHGLEERHAAKTIYLLQKNLPA